jgi:hypothetical protein
MRAKANVFGYTIDAAMDPATALGRSPNKTLNKTAPIRKAFPKDSFFRIKKSTRTNTIMTLTMAGMWSIIDISI